MTKIALLSYVPDPFAVQASKYLLRIPGEGSHPVSAGDLSDWPEYLLTYDVPALVDDLRQLGRAPPNRIVDIGDALRLSAGRSKDDGGERQWDVWPRLRQHFRDKNDAARFHLMVSSREKRPESEELGRLLEEGIEALQELWSELAIELRDKGELDRLLEVDWPVQGIFAYRQFRGIRIDREGAEKLHSSISSEKYGAYTQVATTLNRSPTGLNFWNVRKYLAKTDVAHLQDLDAGGSLQDAFEMASSQSSFARAFLTFVRAGRDEAVVRRAMGAEERLHPIFNIFGTITSRIVVWDPPLQQLRRSRRSLLVPDPNMRLVYLDFAQFEPGIMSALSQDEALISAYNDGDMYNSLAEQIFRDVRRRQEAKRIFLAFLYGMSPERIALLLSGVGGSSSDREQLAENIKLFFRKFPGISRYRESQCEQLLKHGSVQSMFGNRRVRIGSGALSGKETRWALNHPVQSTASLIFKEALRAIDSEIGREHIVLPVHDAVLLQFVDDDGFKGLADAALNLMIEAFRKRFPCINARVSVGKFAE